MTTRALAWTLWTTTALQVAFGFALGSLNHLDARALFAEYVVAMACGALAFASVGVLVVLRQPRNPIGWMFCVLGVGFGTGWMTEYTRFGLLEAPGALPAGDVVNWVNRWLWMPLLAMVGVYLPLLFPDGRLPSPRWRPVAWIAGLAAALMGLSFAIAPGPIDASQPDVPNAFSPDWAPRVLPVLGPVATTLAGASLLAGLAAPVVRFRHASQEQERAQLKWFAFAATVLVVTLVGPLLVAFPRAFDDTLLSGVVLSIGFPAIPIATGIAIVRYRLFDIDQLIGRTLVYVTLTAGVIGVYLFTVGYLGALLRVGNDLAISLVATGIVAIAFQPARDYLQRAISRLLYGRRDEPYAVLSRLDRQLACTLAPESVLPTIVSEIRSALRLSYVAIALHGTAGELVNTAAEGAVLGETRELPLLYQGEQVGMLCLGARAPGESLSLRDLRLLEDVAQHAGAAVHAARLTAELRRSRERLVLAREEERRRLRRDLHDELAPTLAGLGLVAASVDRLIPTDPPRAQEAARTLQASIREATAGIRRLAHDLRPPALDELGLVQALGERVAQFSSAEAAPRISVEVDGALPPLPAAVEVAAYRIVHEALMNVLRHSRARTCRVCLAAVDGMLSIEVCDDGIGLQPGAIAGVGLRSMRERADELGGACVIENVSPSGTRVAARMPLRRGSGSLHA